MNTSSPSVSRLFPGKRLSPLFRGMGPAALIALLLTPAPSAGATFTADTIGGYSTQVLAQILQVWQEPMGARGTAVLELTIDPSGSLAGCAIRKNSVTPAADAALCAAAQNAAPYPYAPFGAQAVVSLGVSYTGGKAEGSVERAPSYAEMLRQSIAPRIIMPQGLSGSWTTVVRIDVWADGSVKDCRITAPSGNAQVDAAVMAAVQSPGAITPPPAHMEQSVSLSFTLSAR
ncbi:TonB family protein [uncultured Mailhella sp.]|uniref:TonB family protein n=1 Tax=uncultured Mailhella sp. TaxID=1981031 RepID=UPI0025F9F1DF|nr:TonB family protein [uncultured Mailhella sp.]